MAIISAERLAEAARLLLAANTSDFEDCDVCAVLEVECPYHQGRRDEHNEAVEKPAEPIVWDGTEEAHDTIEELLHPLGVMVLLDDIDADVLDEPMTALQLRVSSNSPTVGVIPPMGRIRREGDSFAILPPEVKS